jgi:hypothetical protein
VRFFEAEVVDSVYESWLFGMLLQKTRFHNMSVKTLLKLVFVAKSMSHFLSSMETDSGRYFQRWISGAS